MTDSVLQHDTSKILNTKLEVLNPCPNHSGLPPHLLIPLPRWGEESGRGEGKMSKTLHPKYLFKYTTFGNEKK